MHDFVDRYNILRCTHTRQVYISLIRILYPPADCFVLLYSFYLFQVRVLIIYGFVVLIRSLHLVWLSVSLASSSLHFFMSPVHATLHPRACLQRMGFFSTNNHVQERNRISRSQRTHHASNTHFAALRRVEGLLKLRA